MAENCIFCRIINQEIPTKILHEDDKTIAFEDINPQAPYHFIIIPKEHIETINDLDVAHNELVGHLFQVAKKLAKEYRFEQEGYRTLINCNRAAGQTVFHLHLHVLGGRFFSWPPG